MAKKPSIKQIWFVSPILVAQDGSKPMIYPVEDNQQQEEAPQEAQPRNRNELRLGNLPVTSGNDYGYTMQRNNVVTIAWNSKKAADEYAKQQASKNPKTAYGVFSCCDVFETTVPEVIEKQFNAQGELIVRKQMEKTDDSAAESI